MGPSNSDKDQLNASLELTLMLPSNKLTLMVVDPLIELNSRELSELSLRTTIFTQPQKTSTNSLKPLNMLLVPTASSHQLNSIDLLNKLPITLPQTDASPELPTECLPFIL